MGIITKQSVRTILILVREVSENLTETAKIPPPTIGDNILRDSKTTEIPTDSRGLTTPTTERREVTTTTEGRTTTRKTETEVLTEAKEAKEARDILATTALHVLLTEKTDLSIQTEEREDLTETTDRIREDLSAKVKEETTTETSTRTSIKKEFTVPNLVADMVPTRGKILLNRYAEGRANSKTRNNAKRVQALQSPIRRTKARSVLTNIFPTPESAREGKPTC